MQGSTVSGRIGRVALAGLSDAAALVERLEAVREDGEVRVVVVDGRGCGTGFRAGDAALRLLARYALPVVFFASGQRVAGDLLAVAACCDIRVCDHKTRWALDGGESERTQLLLAESGLARRLLRLGRPLDAETAALVGLTGVAEDAEGEALRLAGVIAERGPVATQLGKEAVWRGLEMPLEQGLRFELDLTLLLQTTKDRAEGVRAFLEKRTPSFTGE